MADVDNGRAVAAKEIFIEFLLDVRQISGKFDHPPERFQLDFVVDGRCLKGQDVVIVDGDFSFAGCG